MNREEELSLLDKQSLIDIILEQERRASASSKGKPKRHNLVDRSFGALKVIADAGSEKGHSLWHCKCSGDYYDAEANLCGRVSVFWGSNLKNERQEYCGDKDCPAARQLLAIRRKKEYVIDDDFLMYLNQQLRMKYSLMGNRSYQNQQADTVRLWRICCMYFGINEQKSAYKFEEIENELGGAIAGDKKELEGYLRQYTELKNANEVQ